VEQKQIHMTPDQIKVGDFIQGQYRYGCINGKVIKVLKNKVVIQKYSQFRDEYTPTDQEVNVTISRVSAVNPPGIILLS
jgi:hypothetical protein